MTLLIGALLDDRTRGAEESTEAREQLLERLNNHVSDNNIDLAQFSLSRPITSENLVDDWEKVNALIQSFDEDVRNWIWHWH